MATSNLTPPERLVREARKGRFVVFVAGDQGPREKIRALPAGVWFESASAESSGITAGQIEEGELKSVPAGSVVALNSASIDVLGTPRRPTRFRAWLEQVLRCRTALVIGESTAVRSLAGPSFERRHFLAPGEQLEGFLDELLQQARGAKAKAPPPLPGAISPWGFGVLVVTAALAVASWLLLYISYGAAQNWRWLHLVPGAVAAVWVVAALLPWLRDVVAGHQLAASESYARFLGRWSQWPRALLLAAVLLLVAFVPRWIAREYTPATFLVVYESAYVSTPDGDVGACKAEEPCILVVRKDAHLHFEGAEGACGMDLLGDGAMVIIDMQDESCRPAEREGEPGTRG